MDDRGTITRMHIRNAALSLRAEVADREAARSWFTVQDVVERLDHRVGREEVEETLLTMASRGLLIPQPAEVAVRRFSPPETLRHERRRGRRPNSRPSRG